MDIVEGPKQFTTSMLGRAIPAAPENDGRYRVIAEIKTNQGTNPLLWLGTARGKAEDGSCIAIQNPNAELIKAIRPGTVNHYHELTENVSKRCDVMLRVASGRYKDDGVIITATYVAHSPQPAKFCFV